MDFKLKRKTNEKAIFINLGRTKRKLHAKKRKFKTKKNKFNKLSTKILLIKIIISLILIIIFLSIKIFLKKRRPKIIAISYANHYFQRQIELNRKSAIEVGKVDEHYSYGPEDIDSEFREKNKEILSRKRGNGYWLWKPYIINKTIVEKLKEGDYLIYTDAAILYMNSSYLLIDFLKKNKAEMWMYRLVLKERKYSKRDAFILMGVDSPIFSETNQYMAGVQIYKKSKYTVKFIQELLNYSQDKRIITDDKNVMGKHNYHGFLDNRHEQTVLSLLIKKYGEANAGSPNLSLEELLHRKSNIMPNILCMYRRTKFKDYEDLKNICIKIINAQKHFFS